MFPLYRIVFAGRPKTISVSIWNGAQSILISFDVKE